MRHKFLMASALLSTCLFAAENEPTHLIVEFNNNTVNKFLLDSLPVITYSNDSTFITGSVSAAYLTSTVRNYHFYDKPIMGTDLTTANCTTISYLDNSTLQILWEGTDTKMALYTANGSVCQTRNIHTSEQFEIGLPNQKGVYVLKIGSEIYKVIKR